MINKIICFCGPDRIKIKKIIEGLFRFFPWNTFQTCGAIAINNPVFFGTEWEVQKVSADMERANSSARILIIQPHMESWISLQKKYGSSMFNIFIPATQDEASQNFKQAFGEGAFSKEFTGYLMRASRQEAFYRENDSHFHYHLETAGLHFSEISEKISCALKEREVVLSG